MKRVRILALVLVLLLLLSTAACQKQAAFDTSPEFNAETDCQPANVTQTYSIAESPTGYYFLDRYYLRYAEKSTLESISLCGKPNCIIHEDDQYSNGIILSEVQQCDAFVDLHSTDPIFYYNGALYCVEKQSDPITYQKFYQLLSISPEGSQRKNIFELQWSEEIVDPVLQDYLLHRGRFYYFIGDQDTDPDWAHYLYCFDLTTGKHQLLAQFSENPQKLTAVGNHLYILTAKIIGDTVEENLYRMTISTGEMETLPEGYLDVLPVGEELIFVCSNADYSEKWAVVTDREGNNGTRVELPSLNYLVAANEKYWCYQRIDEYVCDIYDRATNELLGSLPFSPFISLLRFSGDSLLSFGCEEIAGRAKVHFADLSALGTDAFAWRNAEED